MQIGLLFPWQLLLSRAGVRGVLSFLASNRSTRFPSLRRVAANINVGARYVIAVSAFFTQVFMLHPYDLIL